MEKKILSMAALAGMVLFAACSNDSEVPVDGGKEAGILSFELVPDAGVTTRAGRDLYSAEALQKVTDMKVYAFKKTGEGEYTYEQVTILNSDGSTAASQPCFTVDWAEGTGSKTYNVKPKFADGSIYEFLAVGLDAGKANYTLALTPGTTKIEEAVLALNGNVAAREAFAGVSPEIMFSSSTGTKVSITLKRAVAGVLGYFANIPVSVDGTAVSKVAVKLYANQSNAVNLATKAGSGEAANSQTLISIDIPSGATQADGKYTWAENVQAINGVATVANSIIGGVFTLPKAIPANGYTLYVELQDAGAVMLKNWNVKINTAQSGEEATGKQYSLQANSFYSIGKKLKDNTTTDPDNPGNNDDPIDLSKDQDIVLTVDPNWDAIHDMGVE